MLRGNCLVRSNVACMFMCYTFRFVPVKILRAEIGQRLLKTPCALITSKFGWTGNMQRIIASQTHSKSQDVQRE